MDFDFGHKYDYLNQISGEREKERGRELKRARESESDRVCVRERRRARKDL